MNAEQRRLEESSRRTAHWKRGGPYVSERAWGTVREDYSADGCCWEYLPHDHARSRAYRWGEDGLLGLCDRQGRLCFAIALWNGQDAILKERLAGGEHSPAGRVRAAARSAARSGLPFEVFDAAGTRTLEPAVTAYPVEISPALRRLADQVDQSTA